MDYGRSVEMGLSQLLWRKTYRKHPTSIGWLQKVFRFNKAYVQSPICGPSRMSRYTGRYVRSHGATWNGFPLRVGEPTLGDHLRELGVKCSLVGKNPHDSRP